MLGTPGSSWPGRSPAVPTHTLWTEMTFWQGMSPDAPEQDQWRVPYLGKLLEQRGELHHQMMDTAELTELIESLCEN